MDHFAKMFNLLPRCLRDYKSDSVDNFKDLLDKTFQILLCQ